MMHRCGLAISAVLALCGEAARIREMDAAPADEAMADAQDEGPGEGPDEDLDDATTWWPWSVSGGGGDDDARSHWWWWQSKSDDARSPFEKYRDESKYGCKPRVYRSECANSDYKGLVVYFHGFTACAAQSWQVAPHLTAGCFDVLAPTMPGMGGPMITCGGERKCTVEIDQGQGFDLTDLPTHAHQYRRFVWRINRLVRDERDFRATQTGHPSGRLEVGAMGLSFGGAMAVYAVKSWRGLYTKQLLINPYFGVGPDVDGTLLNCEQQAAETENWTTWREEEWQCQQRKVMNWLAPMGMDRESLILHWLASKDGRLERTMTTNLVKLSDVYGHLDNSRIDYAPLKDVLDLREIWYENCQKIRAGELEGICAFKKAHLLATHSFAMHALVEATHRTPYAFPVTQAITTQTDGRTRNGFTYALMRHLNNTWFSSIAPEVSMCMFRGAHVPHANLDKEGAWWNEHLFGMIAEFLGGRTSVSDAEHYTGDPGQCTALRLDRHAMHDVADMKYIVTPSAAPSRSTQLWPGALWRLLRASDDLADLVLFPRHMRERAAEANSLAHISEDGMYHVEPQVTMVDEVR